MVHLFVSSSMHVVYHFLMSVTHDDPACRGHVLGAATMWFVCSCFDCESLRALLLFCVCITLSLWEMCDIFLHAGVAT